MNNPMDENGMAKVPQPTAKKKTWAIMLAAIVSFLVVLAVSLVILFACNNSGTEQPIDDPVISVGEVNSEFFAADTGYVESLYTKEGAYELEGKLVDIYEELALAATKVTDIDNFNFDVDTVKMVDLITGKTLFEMRERNERGVAPKSHIDAEFCDACGVFVVTITRYDDVSTPDVDESTVEIYHYTSKTAPEFLGVTDSRGHECRDLGDVYAIRVDKKISFFDEEMNLLSDKNGDFIDVDDIPYLSADSFMVSEKEGYFYFFTSKEALVFNMQGDCTAKFSDNQTTYGDISAHVLNDGRLLIQRYRVLEETAKSYDIRIGTILLDVETMIMDNITGKIVEIECNFIVNNLSAAYEKDPYDSGFPLLLKDGFQNQAYITYFENGAPSPEEDYVVLDNSLKVQYTFPRYGNNIAFDDAFAIDESRLVAKVVLGSENQYHLFDINGGFISVFPINDYYITDSFIVSGKVIYNHEMKEIYNFAKENFVCVGVTGDVVYLNRYNEATQKDEVYSFTNTASEPTLSVNGIDLLDYAEITNDYCVILDDLGWKTVYNLNGEIIAASDGKMTLTPIEGALIMSNEINGTVRNYVLLEAKS